jgi:hypothetical protein
MVFHPYLHEFYLLYHGFTGISTVTDDFQTKGKHPGQMSGMLSRKAN